MASMDGHVLLREALRSQQAAALQSLRRHFPATCRIAIPDGGYFLWLELANDVDALENAGEARQSCITALIAIEDERRSLCRMMNVSPDPAGIEKLLQWCDPSRQLLDRRLACSQRATQCRSLNDRNGALVTARLKRVEGMLGVITGRAGQTQVYGSKGGYDSPSRSDRVLARV